MAFQVKNIETSVSLIRIAGFADLLEFVLHELVEDHLHGTIVDFFITNFVTAAFARLSTKGRGVGMLAGATAAAPTSFTEVDRSDVVESQSQSHVEHLLFSDK
jgi:hypothetical protein